MRKDQEHYYLFQLIFILFIYQSLSFQLLVNRQNNQTQKQTQRSINQQIICNDGNRYQYISSFNVGRQTDLTQTFKIIQKNIKLDNVTYSDKPGKQYKIFNFMVHLQYFQTKQNIYVRQPNILNISGANVRITYNFTWQKKQLQIPVYGNGTGVVSTDAITYQKRLFTNKSHDLEWAYYNSTKINISNSLTLSTIYPFKQLDYDIINLMVGNSTPSTKTLKNQLIQGLNTNFIKQLQNIIKEVKTMEIQKQISYIYNDYRGLFSVDYNNKLLNNSLTKNGLGLKYSQVIRNMQDFECGTKVPFTPESLDKYGGTQQYFNNQLLKNSLLYALRQKFLDSTLTQQNWQSRAFQFFMGDFHDVMYLTKNISSFKSLNGKCLALDDQNFQLIIKTNTTYSVLVNFTCVLNDNISKIFDLIMPVQFEIQPRLSSKSLDFLIKDIKGTPIFNESFPRYKISNNQLANFILTQTLNTAKKTTVIGSGYKIRNRKNPKYEVRQGYLFLYDKSSV